MGEIDYNDSLLNTDKGEEGVVLPVDWFKKKDGNTMTSSRRGHDVIRVKWHDDSKKEPT